MVGFATLPSRLALILALLLAVIGNAADAYTVSGSFLAYENGPNGGIAEGEDSVTDGAYALRDFGDVSSETQNATARYFTNLRTGRLGTYVRAFDLDPDAYLSAPGARADAYFQDVISFAVPAGSYEDGLYAYLSGFTVGYLEALGAVGGLDSDVRALGTFTFGNTGDAYSFGFDQTAFGRGPTAIVLNEAFTLMTELVAPGQVVAEGGMLVSRNVTAFLETYGSALHAYGYVNVPDSSSMLGDFFATGGFTSISVAEGVIWSSGSGIFLSAVPLPAATWLFGSSIPGLLFAARRKDMHKNS